MAKTFDEILEDIGTFGRYQRLVYLTMAFSGIAVAFHNTLHVFTGATPAHLCAFPSGAKDLQVLANSHQRWFGNQSQVNSDYGSINNTTVLREQCQLTVYDGNNVTESNSSENTAKCKEWDYVRSQYEETVASQWDLVCDRQWMVSFSQSLHMAGTMVGVVLGGILADRFGRRRTLLAAVILQLSTGVGAAFSPHYVVYCLLRMLVGVAIATQYNCIFIIAVEIVGARWRLVAGTSLLYMNALGIAALAGLAYVIRNWATLQLVASSILVVNLIYFWIVPESPRWLLLAGRKKAAVKLVVTIANFNKRPLPQEFDLAPPIQTADSAKVSMFDLFKTPRIRSRTLKISCIWLLNTLVYYGLTLNTSHLGGNDYINFMMSGLVEIPALIVVNLAGDRIGRRWMMAGPLFLSGASLLATAAVPNDLHTPRVALAMVGKLGVTCAFATIYSVAAELFPTSVRSNGLGVSGMSGRLGGFVAPFIGMLNNYGRVAPLILCGILAFLSSLLTLMLPETYKLPLYDTVEEAERAPLADNCLCASWCTSKSKLMLDPESGQEEAMLEKSP